MQDQDRKIALRAVKISLISVTICFLFFTISAWILLNQITATANLVKDKKELQTRIEILEKKVLQLEK